MTEWNFSNHDLTDTNFRYATLNNTDFTNAILSNAYFYYATLTNANFTNAKLSNAYLRQTTLTDANFTNTDLRGAVGTYLSQLTLTQNMIHPDAHVEGLILTAGQSMRLWDYNNTDHPQLMHILIEDELTLDPTSTLTMIFEDDQWGSTLTFGRAIPVSLAGTLELLLDPTLDPASLLGTTFDLFDWDNITLTTTFDYLATSPNLTWDTSLLYTTGQVTLTAIPEPTTLTLITLTSLAALNPRRKQRKA